MNRRDAVSAVAILLGGTIVGADMLLTGCKPAGRKAAGIPMTQDDVAFLDEVAETIIPATSTPGAKAAKVGQFMNTMVTDCYTADDQKVFLAGIGKIDDAAQKKYSKGFMELDGTQKHDLLVELDTEAKTAMKNRKDGEAKPYFRMMKELTLLGYFTSKEGATMALRYVPVPGRYEGCIPYKKGEKAFATS
jgi:Gluconate 2-dehydrogenase subunit 3